MQKAAHKILVKLTPGVWALLC